MIDLNELDNKIKLIESSIKKIEENSEIRAKSLRDYSIGDRVIVRFRDIQLILIKEASDLYEVYDNGNSKKLKNGDYLKIKDPNSRLEIGEKIDITVLRPALEYKTDIITKID